MTLRIDQFEEFFQALWGRPPFPWQSRLARHVFTAGWPGCIDLPTASGKTACIDVAVFVMACQVHLPPQKRTVGRRVFFTVNRRVIVDEAYQRAYDLARKLRTAELDVNGVLCEVATALRTLNEENDVTVAPPLAIAQLRGGVYRDASWARSLTQPLVICTTVDQVGSRMLFRGYGVSDKALPIHAALCTHDATVLLDEAHVTKAFCETLSLLSSYQHVRTDSVAVASPFRYVEMTATPQSEGQETFRLDEADYANPVLSARQQAAKCASLISLEKKKSLVDTLSQDALKISQESPKAIGIIVNRVQTARDIAKSIEKLVAKDQLGFRVHLVIGRMRPYDRTKLEQELRSLVGPDRPAELEESFFIVATQCLEVGADFDFDVLLTECASIDALRQRFGRLNRAGRFSKSGEPINALASIYFQESADRAEDPIYGSALLATWNWLTANATNAAQVDFGIGQFKQLWESANQADRDAMMRPSAHATVLLPAHLDLLCQTSPRPMPEPEVEYFIHGPRRDNAEVNVCWRADLGNDSRLWGDIVRLLPPSSLECMAVPIAAFRRWISGQAIDAKRDADVPTAEEIEDARSTKPTSEPKVVVRWRGTGEQTIVTSDGNDFRPGDTVVVSVKDEGWNELGHIPCLPKNYQLQISQAQAGGTSKSDELIDESRRHIDIAEECYRMQNRRFVIRMHAAFEERWHLRSLPKQELRESLPAVIKDESIRDSVSELIKCCRFERHPYPAFTIPPDLSDTGDQPPHDEIVYLSGLLPDEMSLELLANDQEDEDDDRSQLYAPVSLAKHTSHVLERVSIAAQKLSCAFTSELQIASKCHDLGKADSRFQAMLSGTTPYEALERGYILAKGAGRRLTIRERGIIRDRALLPKKFRHEFLSAQLASAYILPSVDRVVDHDLVLRIIESHHGHARPLAQVVFDSDGLNESLDELRGIYIARTEHWPEIDLEPDNRRAFPPVHRLDSGVTDRFWRLVRRLGWWGLAFTESVMRLGDQQASADEERDRP